jgi:hypothetical protein
MRATVVNDLNLIQLAAKDYIVKMYGHFVLGLSTENWTKMVNDRMCAILDMTMDDQFEIINLYRNQS